MSDYPIREKAARQPKPNNPFTRSCQSCGACFLALAVGITGERGIWTECGRWWCSRECAPTTDAPR